MKTIIILAPFVLLLGACSLLVEFEDQKTPTERNCDDQRDNDNDGFTDCADQDCEFDEACTGPNVNNLNNVYNNMNNINNLNNVIGPEICDDGVDNDGDGLTDCDDGDECWNHPSCAPAEDCFDEWDNDGDGAIDCRDPDCWMYENCDRLGERDCGDGVDNEPADHEGPEGDGRVDCMDPECATNPLCTPQVLVRCNDNVEYYNNFQTIYYYKDIYQTASSGDCPENHFCTVRPELSRVPYCFPMSGTNPVPAYGVCGPTLKCGTGLLCAWSDTLSQSQNSDVCLPLCAPGHVNTCIGSQGICYKKLDDAFDGFLGLIVETWLCDQPACDPMSTDTGNVNCPFSTSTCIPATDLMGGAFCHSTVGTVGPGVTCTSDNDCVKGHICRQGPLDGGVNRCHPLCRTDGHCLQTSGCVKTDNRQYFGFCK